MRELSNRCKKRENEEERKKRAKARIYTAPLFFFGLNFVTASVEETFRLVSIASFNMKVKDNEKKVEE